MKGDSPPLGSFGCYVTRIKCKDTGRVVKVHDRRWKCQDILAKKPEVLAAIDAVCDEADDG